MSTVMPTESHRSAIRSDSRKWLILAAIAVVGLTFVIALVSGVILCAVVPAVAEHVPVRGGAQLEQLGAIVRPHFVDGQLLVEVIIPYQWRGTDSDLLLIGQVSNVAGVSIERDLSETGLANLGKVPSLRYIDATGLASETKAVKKRLLRRVCPAARICDSDERVRPLIPAD